MASKKRIEFNQESYVMDTRFALMVGINDYSKVDGYESLKHSHTNIDYMKEFWNKKGYETKTLREGARDGLEEWSKAIEFLKNMAKMRMTCHKSFALYFCANYKIVDGETFLVWGTKELGETNITQFLRELSDIPQTHVIAVLEGSRVEPLDVEWDGEDFDCLDFSSNANTADRTYKEVKGQLNIIYSNPVVEEQILYEPNAAGIFPLTESFV